MLFNLLVPLSDQFSPLNVFRYLTFRSGGAVITSLLICFVFGQPIIDWLRRAQKHGQPIREDGPESHLLTKKGTPTMGGDRKSTRLNSSHMSESRMPSSA